MEGIGSQCDMGQRAPVPRGDRIPTGDHGGEEDLVTGYRGLHADDGVCGPEQPRRIIIKQALQVTQVRPDSGNDKPQEDQHEDRRLARLQSRAERLGRRTCKGNQEENPQSAQRGEPTVSQ